MSETADHAKITRLVEEMRQVDGSVKVTLRSPDVFVSTFNTEPGQIEIDEPHLLCCLEERPVISVRLDRLAQPEQGDDYIRIPLKDQSAFLDLHREDHERSENVSAAERGSTRNLTQPL